MRSIWGPAHSSSSLPSSIQPSRSCSLLSLVPKRWFVVSSSHLGFAGGQKSRDLALAKPSLSLCALAFHENPNLSQTHWFSLVFLSNPGQTSPKSCQKSLPTLIKTPADFKLWKTTLGPLFTANQRSKSYVLTLKTPDFIYCRGPLAFSWQHTLHPWKNLDMGGFATCPHHGLTIKLCILKAK